jgi:hypothetical protein|tara:strand:+ start:1750 stop:2439 length:690 start_codon:yes stop_codon:yes gene_type:complete
MKQILFLILLFAALNIFAQKEELDLRFNVKFNNEILELNKQYFLTSANDSIKIETLKFFVSDFKFLQNKTVVDSLSKKHHLIDLENDSSTRLKGKRSNQLSFNKIKFNVGIDSLTNDSGVFGGDLDPTNGMYWTWQSGYINFKLEGKSQACPTRNNLFQFHIGGYLAPYSALRSIELDILNKKITLIDLDIDTFLSNINLTETHSVMSPNKTAVILADIFPKAFTIADE